METRMDEAAGQRRKNAEDRVSQFLNGGNCTITMHPSATLLDKLLMLKQIRLDLRYQSCDLAELESAIKRELNHTS